MAVVLWSSLETLVPHLGSWSKGLFACCSSFDCFPSEWSNAEGYWIVEGILVLVLKASNALVGFFAQDFPIITNLLEVLGTVRSI